MLARHVLGADVVIVAMGPGVVGTGTALGTTALEVAPILDAAAALGGRPVACVRVSDADQRARHRGVSHHTVTALRLTRVRGRRGGPRRRRASTWADDTVFTGVEPPDVGDLLDRLDLRVTTMGRGPEEEPRFFAACGAAGDARRVVCPLVRIPGWPFPSWNVC